MSIESRGRLVIFAGDSETYRLVVDQTTDDMYAVFQPSYKAQFAGGHIAGYWYWRPFDHPIQKPVTCAYDTFDDALESLRRTLEARDAEI